MKHAHSVDEFCHQHGISRGLLYKLWRTGRGPITMKKIGKRTLISEEAAEKWRRRMESDTAGSAGEAA